MLLHQKKKIAHYLQYVYNVIQKPKKLNHDQIIPDLIKLKILKKKGGTKMCTEYSIKNN